MKMQDVVKIENEYINDFLNNSAYSRNKKYYAIRDNCGPCALDFIDYMQNTHGIILKRQQGEFYADVPVHTKNDFYADELIKMKTAGLNPNSNSDRIQYMIDNDLVERQKMIPHYWTVDADGKILDPSGYLQFVKTGLSKDLDDSRYHIKK